MIGAEFLKMRKRLMTKVLPVIMVGIIVLVNLLLLAISKASLPAGTPQRVPGNIDNLLGLSSAVPFALSLISSFGVVLAVILAASSMGNEYNWKTIRPALISCESRFKFLTAKLIALGLMILIGMAVAVLAGIIISLITNGIGGYSYDFGFLTGDYARQQVYQFLRTFFIITPFTLLGFMMSIAGRSAMPGIAAGIGIFFLESIVTTFMRLAGGWIAQIPDYLLNANMQAITALNQLPRGFGGMANSTGGTPPSVTHAFITLGLYALAFLALAYYLFRKRDVTG